MKKLSSLIFLLLTTLCLNAQNAIMTYNIRYNNPNDRENWWENRKTEVADMIEHYRPDIFGIQEGLKSQVSYLDSSLDDYGFVGVGRDDGKEKGEHAAIFFNKATMELIETKTYWFSETPNRVSVGWDASMERIVTYGKFKDKSSQQIIHIFNCHYDHIGKVARENSSHLVLKLIEDKGIENERIAVIGDFNSLPNQKPITVLLNKLSDAYIISQSKPYGPIGTFNSFNTQNEMADRLDYILVKNIAVKQYINIDDRRKNNLWLSDHTPVLAKLK